MGVVAQIVSLEGSTASLGDPDRILSILINLIAPQCRVTPSRDHHSGLSIAANLIVLQHPLAVIVDLYAARSLRGRK
jgi:hypothetical protein